MTLAYTCLLAVRILNTEAMALSKPCLDNFSKEADFSKLSANQLADRLLAAEPNSPDWRRCVEALGRVEAVAFDQLDSVKSGRWHIQCQHLLQADSKQTLMFVQPPFKFNKCTKITAAKVDEMLPVLVHCHVKCLSLDGYRIDSQPHVEFDHLDTLKKLLKALPQLECLNYGRIKLPKPYNLDKWQSFCREFGPRLKHLAIDGVHPLNGISILIAASPNLELVHLKPVFTKQHEIKCLEPLKNRPFDLTLEFYVPIGDVDAEAAAVISRAKKLSIWFGCLHSAARHCPKFDSLTWLDVKYPRKFDSFDKLPALEFPALEHLFYGFQDLAKDAAKINHMNIYNLADLKSLKLASTHNNDILTAATDQLTSVEELAILSLPFSPDNQLPIDSLLRLKRLVDLRVVHALANNYDLPIIIRLFKVVSKMRQLKQCRLQFRSFIGLKPISNALDQKLTQAQADLRQALPFVEIFFPYRNWIITGEEGKGEGDGNRWTSESNRESGPDDDEAGDGGQPEDVDHYMTLNLLADSWFVIGDIDPIRMFSEFY